MPQTRIFFFQDQRGRVPVREWLEAMSRMDVEGFGACVERIEQLELLGHELRRPLADYLDHGVYELRARCGTVQYRLLYGFVGNQLAVISHGMIKKSGPVSPADMKRARDRLELVRSNPDTYLCREDWREGL